MTAETLTCSHFSELNPLIRKLQSPISEYSFANLYLFRKQHDYRLVHYGEHVFLQGVTYDNIHYMMPFAPIAEIGEPALKELMKEGFAIFPVEEKDLIHFDSNIYSFSYNDDDSDYVYLREKIVNLPGRYLHKKRNLITQYRKLYQYDDKPYSCELQADAKAALDKWFELGQQPVEDTDYVACMEALEHCDELKLSGQMYYADGVPVGFLLGEVLNKNTFVIHFAKGVTTFKGIYSHMYNSMAAALPEKFVWMNFEQDMGKESLRQAKSTYKQDIFLRKYRVTLK